MQVAFLQTQGACAQGREPDPPTLGGMNKSEFHLGGLLQVVRKNALGQMSIAVHMKSIIPRRARRRALTKKALAKSLLTMSTDKVKACFIQRCSSSTCSHFSTSAMSSISSRVSSGRTGSYRWSL